MLTNPRQLSLLNPAPPTPGRARRTDPQTSKQAAASINAGTLQMKVYDYIVKHGPCILDDVWPALQMEKGTVSPRFKPLKEVGLIELTGRKRKGLGPVAQQEWRAVARPQ